MLKARAQEVVAVASLPTPAFPMLPPIGAHTFWPLWSSLLSLGILIGKSWHSSCLLGNHLPSRGHTNKDHVVPPPLGGHPDWHVGAVILAHVA